MANNSDFLKDFVEEALAHVDSAEAGLLKLENGEGDADIIHSIFRNLHSIKGTAGFFSLKNIVRLSHAMENLFGEIRNGSLVIDNRMIDVLLSANDCLKQMIMDAENSEMEDISEHTARIAKALNSKSGEQQSDSSPGPATANNYGGFFSGEIDIEEIRETARRGQRFYKIKIAPGNNPPEMLKKIESIGSIAGNSGSSGTPGPGDAFDVLVATVLESNLISLALDIAEENIIPLDEQDLLTEERYKSREGLPTTRPYLAETAGVQSSTVPNISGKSARA